MRAGLVTDFYYPWVGGPATVVRMLAQGLSARGHHVSILAPSPSGPEADEVDGQVEVRRIRSWPVPFGYRLRSTALPIGAAGRWLDAFQPDVIQIHHPFSLSVAALVAARRRGIPVVATNHTIPECSLWGVRHLGPGYRLAEWAFGQWINIVMRSCATVTTPTLTAAGYLSDLGFSGPVLSISNGVDVGRFHPGPVDTNLRARFGLGAHPVVLYTGRLDAEKDMETWLRAAGEIAGTTDARFLVGGEGTDRSRLETVTANLGLKNRVTFIGYVEEEVFPLLYRLASVYFITSPVELQSIGTLEAIASGLPVVAVRASALPELVEDGESGYLVPAGDANAAARAVESILRNPDLRKNMGSRSREIALMHDARCTIEQYERALEMVAATTRGEPLSEPASV